MKTIIAVFAGLIFATFAFAHAAEDLEETPAQLIRRIPPEYPMKCYPEKGILEKTDIVTVRFDVTEEGKTREILVVNSTNSCLNEAAKEAVRRWTYEPRRVGGQPAPQDGLETTFDFVFDIAPEEEDLDATPRLRYRPSYPDRCVIRADQVETVLLEFDVAANGKTQNIRVIESTNPCLNNSAIEAVEKWRYYPKVIDGEPVVREGVRAIIEFVLKD